MLMTCGCSEGAAGVSLTDKLSHLRACECALRMCESAEEATPKTPQVASVSPTRRAAGDATSTLLNFLKQEQAIATDSLTKPTVSPQQQQQGQSGSNCLESKEDVTATST
jgi:hypothetical protein